MTGTTAPELLTCIGIGVGSFVLPLPVFFALANREQLLPDRVHQAAAHGRVLLIAVVDRARDLLVTVLLAAVRHLEPKGAGR
ncbi:hypothetical protein ACWDE0_21790 [Streptomyces sp. 900105755]